MCFFQEYAKVIDSLPCLTALDFKNPSGNYCVWIYTSVLGAVRSACLPNLQVLRCCTRCTPTSLPKAIEDLDKFLKKCENLTSLSLRGSSHFKLDREIFHNVVHLTELSLSFVSLIPITICSLAELRFCAWCTFLSLMKIAANLCPRSPKLILSVYDVFTHSACDVSPPSWMKFN